MAGSPLTKPEPMLGKDIDARRNRQKLFESIEFQTVLERQANRLLAREGAVQYHLIAGTPATVMPGDFNLSGTHANRPAAGTAGRTYFETDTHVLYRDSGSAWEATGPGFVRKAANQILTQSDTTLQNVTDLVFPVEIGEDWIVEAILNLAGAAAAATADWKFGWTAPAGLSANWGVIADPVAIAPGAMWHAVGIATAGSGARAINNTVSIGAVSGGTTGAILIGRFQGATNAGTLQLQAAQDTAQAVNLTVNTGSIMRLTRIL